jgi:GT2 family glycosyltransferase
MPFALERPRPRVYPRIDPPSPGPRPFWSVMVPSHNRGEYIAETLRSVLAEDIGPERMQVEVVDDCSSEDVEAVVAAVGGGRVAFFRQPENRGWVENWNTCIRRARGEWVHLLHDDDVVLPGFYSRAEGQIRAHPEVVLVFQRAIAIDDGGDWLQLMNCHLTESGIVPNALRSLTEGNFVTAPTAAVPRRAYEQIGGFALHLSDAMDWELWMRLAAAGPIAYVRQPGLLYRVHPSSGTVAQSASGALMRECAQAIETGVTLLPAAERAAARTRAYRRYALEANVTRSLFENQGDFASALRNALWAFRLRPGAANLARLARTALRAATAAGRSPGRSRRSRPA